MIAACTTCRKLFETTTEDAGYQPQCVACWRIAHGLPPICEHDWHDFGTITDEHGTRRDIACQSCGETKE